MRNEILISLALVFSFSLSGCASDDGGGTSPTTSSPTGGTNTTGPAPTGVEKKQTFTLTDVNAAVFDIQPVAYAAKQNDTLNFTVTAPSTNQVAHNFKITDFGVAITGVAAGQSKMVTFVASKKGEFDYFCDVGNHRQLGMEGTLTIS